MLEKHRLATLTTTIVENVETEALGMLTLGLDVPEQKKLNLKLLLNIFQGSSTLKM